MAQDLMAWVLYFTALIYLECTVAVEMFQFLNLNSRKRCAAGPAAGRENEPLCPNALRRKGEGPIRRLAESCEA